MYGLRYFMQILRLFISLMTSIIPVVIAECIFDQDSYSCFKITQLASSLPNLIVGLIPDGSLDSDTGAPWLIGMPQAILTGLVPRSWGDLMQCGLRNQNSRIIRMFGMQVSSSLLIAAKTVANTGIQGWLDKDLAEIKAGRNFVTVFEAEELLIREEHFLDAHTRYGMACFSIGLNNCELRHEEERWTTLKLGRFFTEHVRLPPCELTCQKLKNKICKDLYGARLLVFRKIFYVAIMIIDVLMIVIAWTALWGRLSLDVQIQKVLTVVAMILSQILGSILLVGTAVLADYKLEERIEKIFPCSGGAKISYLERWDHDPKSPELVFIHKLEKSVTGQEGQQIEKLLDVALDWSKFLCNKEQEVTECLEHSKRVLNDKNSVNEYLSLSLFSSLTYIETGTKFRLPMLPTKVNECECPCRIIMRSLLRALEMCSDKFFMDGKQGNRKLTDDEYKHINSCFTPLSNPLHENGYPQLLGRRIGVNNMTHNHSGANLEIPIVAWCTFWNCREKVGKDFIITYLGIVIGILGILSGLFLQLFTDEYGIWVGAAFSIGGLILSPLRTAARNIKRPHFQLTEQGSK